MSWRIEVKPAAHKRYLRLDRTTRRRIRESLREIEHSERPLAHPRVRPLTGTLAGRYRVRVGSWRILLRPDQEAMVLHAYAILPRGDAY